MSGVNKPTAASDQVPDPHFDADESAKLEPLREYLKNHPEVWDELVKSISDQAVFDGTVGLLVNALMTGVTRYLGDRVAISTEKSRVRAGLMLQLTRDSVWRVFDPTGLLAEHFEEIEAWFSEFRKTQLKDTPDLPDGESYHDFSQPKIPTLISWATRSAAVHSQIWFIEKPTGITCLDPLERWVAGAAGIFAHTIAGHNTYDVPHSGAHSLVNFAQYAVRDVIEKAYPKLNAFQIIGALSELSVASEEHSKATGHLSFVPSPETHSYLWQFDPGQRPEVQDAKHVCKLVGTSAAGSPLLGNHERLFGQAVSLPSEGLHVRMEQGQATLSTSLHGPICRIVHGQLHAVYDSSDNGISGVLGSIRELDTAMPALLAELVTAVRRRQHGCTLVVHLGQLPEVLAGQRLKDHLKLQADTVDTVAGMACVDGAVVMSADGSVSVFACILDGTALPNEVRSRGARYNSALRYSAQNKDCVVIVVSEDGPSSVIREGVDKSRPIEYEVPFFRSSFQYGTWLEECRAAKDNKN